MSAVHERVGMPLDEFIELGNEQPFEIIGGEKIVKLPTVSGHNYVIHLFYGLLSAHLATHNLGKCFIEATYILSERYDPSWVTGSRIPDLMFISTDRWNAYLQTTPDWRDKPYLIVPDLVIEVVSPNDKVSELDAKVDAYLLDGVRLIVVVDPQRHKAVLYRPDAEQPLHLGGDSMLDLSDIIPDFKIALPALFA